MCRTTVFAVIFSLLLGSTAMADSSPTVRFEHKTPANLSLSFKPQKVKWKRETIHIWGVVKNASSTTCEYVTVSFTCLDGDRNFLGRYKAYVDPSRLASGAEGNIDNLSLDSDGQLPAVIQITVAKFNE